MLPPPHFEQLKTVILHLYRSISHTVRPPRLITLKHTTLRQMLVRAEIKPMTDQLFDMLMDLEKLPPGEHKMAGELPKLRQEEIMIRPCRMAKCSTCTHLNCSPSFTSTTTRQRYPI